MYLTRFQPATAMLVITALEEPTHPNNLLHSQESTLELARALRKAVLQEPINHKLLRLLVSLALSHTTAPILRWQPQLLARKGTTVQRAPSRSPTRSLALWELSVPTLISMT
jgi:hypothetical protein